MRRKKEPLTEEGLRQYLPDVQVLEDFPYRKRDRDSYERIKSEWPQARKAFLQELAARYEPELRAKGFTANDVGNLRIGRVPNRMSVHHIVPKDDGGDSHFSNLVLIARSPEHDALHAFLDPQVSGMSVGQTRRVRFPNVRPGVWPPLDVAPAERPEAVWVRTNPPTAALRATAASNLEAVQPSESVVDAFFARERAAAADEAVATGDTAEARAGRGRGGAGAHGHEQVGGRRGGKRGGRRRGHG